MPSLTNHVLAGIAHHRGGTHFVHVVVYSLPAIFPRTQYARLVVYVMYKTTLRQDISMPSFPNHCIIHSFVAETQKQNFYQRLRPWGINICHKFDPNRGAVAENPLAPGPAALVSRPRP